MNYKTYEQWDERNFRFQNKDHSPNIPFADAKGKTSTIEKLVWAALLALSVGVLACN